MTRQKTPPREKTVVPPLVLKTHPVVELTDDRLLELSSLNKDLRLERTAGGDLEIMPPTGGETSNRNVKITARLDAWAERDGAGVAFDSSGGFVLPNGAVRSPDASWVRRERLTGLTVEQKRTFLPLRPDFVIELRSPSDSLTMVKAKMHEYVENGARLGWLLDPEERKVYVYRPDASVELLEGPTELSGDPVLLGFVLDLRPIWEPGF